MTREFVYCGLKLYIGEIHGFDAAFVVLKPWLGSGSVCNMRIDVDVAGGLLALCDCYSAASAALQRPDLSLQQGSDWGVL